MAKKGFKLPGVSPLKQTDSTNGQFFQPLNPRSYGGGSGGSYANPMSYDAYFPTSSIGGASTIESLGDTFSSITKSLSNDSEDSDTSDDVSGSDITINSLGEIPLEKPAIELERGTDPRLQQRIQDAESAGNLKKAARLQGKQDRNIVRQVEGAKRIEQRQSDRTKKTTKRQEEKTTPLDMKDKSPLGFIPNQQIQPQPGLTYQPPVQANQMGVAKPVFSPQTQGMAQTIYGTPEQRQMSMGQQAPVFMKDIPEGDKGAGLRKLPNSVVEQMGYDSATRMVSPLNQKLEIGAKMVGKEIPKKMSKELTDKPRVPVVENTKQAFGITKDGKKVNLGKITSTEIPEKDFKQR